MAKNRFIILLVDLEKAFPRNVSIACQAKQCSCLPSNVMKESLKWKNSSIQKFLLNLWVT